MQIAIIGWGSLIWCLGSLNLRTRWYRDGPLLPVEFARISKGDRLTLVLHPGRSDQRTLWAISDCEDIERALQNLREREGTQSIHSATSDGCFSEGVAESIRPAMTAWLAAHPAITHCLWAGLTSNWQTKRRRQFSVEDAVEYLRNLPEAERAREYVQNAPSQIRTEARTAIRAQLNWPDAELSPVLFEFD